jgi:ribosomal protein S18 acetylase RimI-like enzyme
VLSRTHGRTAELRARAADEPGEPAHLLALRDVSGLADRLEGTSGWEWRGGVAGLSVAPQDLAVLRDLAVADERSPYRDAPAPAAPAGRARALDALTRFLDRYLSHEFAFEGIAPAHPGSSTRAVARRPVPKATIRIAPAVSGADLDAARALFLEYVRAPDWEPGFGAYLAQQDFAAELAALPGAYAPPGGALLLAWIAGRPAGCVAYKPLAPPALCEMKRLYVRPAARGRGVAEHLVRRLLRTARASGYRRMRLDTLPSMEAAQRLYERLGFVDVPPYCANPVPGARYLEADLAVSAPAG